MARVAPSPDSTAPSLGLAPLTTATCGRRRHLDSRPDQPQQRTKAERNPGTPLWRVDRSRNQAAASKTSHDQTEVRALRVNDYSRRRVVLGFAELGYFPGLCALAARSGGGKGLASIAYALTIARTRALLRGVWGRRK